MKKEEIRFKISQEDKKYLQNKANKLRISLGTYVRMIVMSKNQNNRYLEIF